MGNFTCQDIGLASYLKSCGATIEKLIEEDNHCLFVFIDKDLCEKLSIDYWNGIAEGNIKKFEEAKQTLISMIKNRR